MKNDECIVIKETDKGRAVVIMDSAHYEQMVYKQLEDKNTHKKLDPYCDNKTMGENNPLIKKYEKSFLNKKLITWQIFNKKVAIFMVFLKSTNLKLSPK